MGMYQHYLLSIMIPLWQNAVLCSPVMFFYDRVYFSSGSNSRVQL